MRDISSTGTLNDSDIRVLCKKKVLIAENFEEKNIKQACYELRAGNTCYYTPDSKKVIIEKGDYILIKPHQSVVIITEESLDLPNNILARILTKGKLFSIGLLPVNTYADPGFSGKLGIVLNNSSKNYLKIMPLQSIAKIEFSRLEKDVVKPYSGQHGYETEVWPIPLEMILTQDEIKEDKRIGTVESEVLGSYGEGILSVLKQLVTWGRVYFAISFIITAISLLIIVFVNDSKEEYQLSSIVFGFLINIFAAGLFHFALTFKKGM